MKFFTREQTRKVNIGGLIIGGGAPIAVQSMTNTDTRNVKDTIRQIKKLEECGCEIVRVSAPDMEAARKISEIKKKIKIPLAADIHFDYRIAIEAVKSGADKLRINPGNIGSSDRIKAVVKEVKAAKIPIRIGVNAGSLKQIHSLKNNLQRAEALANAAIDNVKILENCNFEDIVVSLKSSDIETAVEAYKIFASKKNYPLHLGITESGSLFSGNIKSAAGLGIMLYGGLGDTIRVSLTADPEAEIKSAYSLLQSLNLRRTGIEIISCPTCARTQIDLIKIVSETEKAIDKIDLLKKFNKPLKIALMGCIVNGPGEAKDADFGIAGGKDEGLLFDKGKIIGKVKKNDWVKTIVKMIEKALED